MLTQCDHGYWKNAERRYAPRCGDCRRERQRLIKRKQRGIANDGRPCVCDHGFPMRLGAVLSPAHCEACRTLAHERQLAKQRERYAAGREVISQGRGRPRGSDPFRDALCLCSHPRSEHEDGECYHSEGGELVCECVCFTLDEGAR